MSDHSDHSHDHAAAGHAPAAPMAPLRLASDYSDGGHEIDVTPSRNLMVFLAVMSVFIVLASLGVYQLFVNHSDSLLEEAASVPAAELAAMRKHDADFAASYGTVEVEGKLVAYRVPFAEAKRAVLANPTLFAATPAPEGWIHPDDAGKK